MSWSGRGESNPRHSAWEADVLPLNYARKTSNFRHLAQVTLGRVTSRNLLAQAVQLVAGPGRRRQDRRSYAAGARRAESSDAAPMFNLFGKRAELPAQEERRASVWRPRPGERYIPFERMEDVPARHLSFTGKEVMLGAEGLKDEPLYRVYEVTDVRTGELLLSTAAPADHPISTYFAAFEIIEQHKRAGDYEAAFRAAYDALPGLRALMMQDIESHGRVVIQSSPPLDFVMRHLVFVEPHGDARRALADLQWMFTEPREVQSWLPYVQGALVRCDLWQRVKEYLRANPGAVQSKLGATMKEDGREIASVLLDAEKRGFVRRDRVAKSYAVTLTEAS